MSAPSATKSISPKRLTVVTVVYNGAAEMEDTILSVTGQNHREIEYVVIDGGSKDDTVEIIKRYDDKIDHWVSEPDKGIYDAMNKGVQLATGQWIVFMNAGDLFHDPQVITDCMAELGKASDKIFVYGNAEIVEGKEKHIQYQRDRHLDFTKSIIHQAMFISREFLKANPYKIQYKIMADYDNLLSVSTVTPDKCLFIDRVICRYDKTGVSSRPLYTYFREFYAVAWKRMSWIDFISFNLYIFPRLIWSYRLALR